MSKGRCFFYCEVAQGLFFSVGLFYFLGLAENFKSLISRAIVPFHLIGVKVKHHFHVGPVLRRIRFQPFLRSIFVGSRDV